MNKLIQEAIERLEKGLENERYIINNWSRKLNPIIGEIFRQELTNIVKESFKNTRVEEGVHDTTECTDEKCIVKQRIIGRNKALSDKHNKECEFLGK